MRKDKESKEKVKEEEKDWFSRIEGKKYWKKRIHGLVV